MRFTSAFNIIGPLTRPCEQNNSIVIGAYSPHVCDQLIAVLKEIGMKTALAPYGTVKGIPPEDGMDEFSISGPTRVVELKNDEIQTYEVNPEDFGISIKDFESIASKKSAEENGKAILETLKGQYDTPLAEFFCVNAAAALYISDFADSYKKGMSLAQEALASGKALEKLELLIEAQS